MSVLEKIRQLWDHAFWADRLVLQAVKPLSNPPRQAVREFAHVIAAEEVWLARLRGRPSRLAVWPSLTTPEIEAAMSRTHADLETYLRELDDSRLNSAVDYRNSNGEAFSTRVDDILLHTALHGQYHRGKVNLILKESGHQPAPCDLIAFVRGGPAASEASAREARRKESDHG